MKAKMRVMCVYVCVKGGLVLVLVISCPEFEPRHSQSVTPMRECDCGSTHLNSPSFRFNSDDTAFGSSLLMLLISFPPHLCVVWWCGWYVNGFLSFP